MTKTVAKASCVTQTPKSAQQSPSSPWRGDHPHLHEGVQTGKAASITGYQGHPDK